ncbi:cation:proton antiporter [Amycolatopsis sp. CA-128772]|uniref:cation:proton antiporter domain-containing protein n=1 Tax=Amycolatopsis sp. CA-128772 TaxID=2073159 RepID=UPI001E524826|nr:cation:proton antiporter [Amycolatopsis sp. CA-128772]
MPTPAFFLVAAAVGADQVPSLRQVSLGVVEDVVTVALIVILFDGGMTIGVRRLRRMLGTVLSTDVLGTFITAALPACAAHLLFGLPWVKRVTIEDLWPTTPWVLRAVTVAVLLPCEADRVQWCGPRTRPDSSATITK